jgi:AAHS family 4-hydroxybenzoate transporter-like MFS transporter
LRATLAIIGVGCVPLGGAIPGFVTAVFVPQYGWQILFLIGGIVPILVAIAAMVGLPESIKFMALHEGQRRKMESTIKAIRPDYQVPATPNSSSRTKSSFPASTRAICSATALR